LHGAPLPNLSVNTSLLASQRDDGIHIRGAPGGDVRRDECHASKQDRDSDKRGRVKSRQPEEHPLQVSRHRRRSSQAKAEANNDECHAATQHEGHDLHPLSADRDPKADLARAFAPLIFSWLAGRGAGATRLNPHASGSEGDLQQHLAVLLRDKDLFTDRLIAADHE